VYLVQSILTITIWSTSSLRRSSIYMKHQLWQIQCQPRERNVAQTPWIGRHNIPWTL